MDYPNSKKAKKVFLCLFVGSGLMPGSIKQQKLPVGLDGEPEGKATFEKRRERMTRPEKNRKRKSVKTKDWILKKKEASSPTVCLGLSSWLLTVRTALP